MITVMVHVSVPRSQVQIRDGSVPRSVFHRKFRVATLPPIGSIVVLPLADDQHIAAAIQGITVDMRKDPPLQHLLAALPDQAQAKGGFEVLRDLFLRSDWNEDHEGPQAVVIGRAGGPG